MDISASRPLHGITIVVAHPHLAAREAFPEVTHPARGKVRVTMEQIEDLIRAGAVFAPR